METDLIVASAYYDEVVEIINDEETLWRKKMKKKMKEVKNIWQTNMEEIHGMMQKVVEKREEKMEKG